MKIYFDLDGVLANMEIEMARILKIPYWDRTSNNHWEKLEKIDRFFYGLEVLPDSLPMFDYVVQCNGIENVEILSALPFPTGLLHTADEDKRAWVADIVSDKVKVNTIIGGKNKHKYLETTPGAILIDDYERNIKLWIEHGGIGVLHTDPHSTIAKLKTIGVVK